MSKATILKISSLLALIFSAVGAILLLVTPWAYWWYSFELYDPYYSGIIIHRSGTVSVTSADVGWVIALGAILLIVCAIISLLTLILPGKIKNRTPIIISLMLAIIVFLMVIIGAFMTVGIMSAKGRYYSFGTGFYAGFWGSLLTIVVTLIMIHAKEK